MKKLAAVVVSIFALGSLSAFSADMTNEERAALRERAAVLQAQRTQNPGQARSDVDLTQKRGDVQLKPKATHTKKAKKTRKTIKKAKHTAKAKAKVHQAKADVGKTRVTR